MESGASIWRAAALGAASGMRTAMGPLILSRAASGGRMPGIRETPFSPLASPRTANLLILPALGELAADKLSILPSRTGSGPLLGRLVTGAVCGAALHAATRRDARIGAALGGVGALTATFAGEWYRRKGAEAGAPDPVLAVLEDACAAGLAMLAVRGQ